MSAPGAWSIVLDHQGSVVQVRSTLTAPKSCPATHLFLPVCMAHRRRRTGARPWLPRRRSEWEARYFTCCRCGGPSDPPAALPPGMLLHTAWWHGSTDARGRAQSCQSVIPSSHAASELRPWLASQKTGLLLQEVAPSGPARLKTVSGPPLRVAPQALAHTECRRLGQTSAVPRPVLNAACPHECGSQAAVVSLPPDGGGRSEVPGAKRAEQ